MRLPEYRPWAGFSLWIGATVLDFVWTTAGAYPSPNWAGAVSFAGFLTAFAWAQNA